MSQVPDADLRKLQRVLLHLQRESWALRNDCIENGFPGAWNCHLLIDGVSVAALRPRSSVRARFSQSDSTTYVRSATRFGIFGPTGRWLSWWSVGLIVAAFTMVFAVVTTMVLAVHEEDVVERRRLRRGHLNVYLGVNE